MANHILSVTAMAAAALLLAACGRATPPPDPGAPEVAVRDLADLPTPLPSPYPEDASEADVDAAIEAAFADAARDGKRVIVDLGGNWCSWCRSLAGVMELPEVAPFIEQNFEIVFVNVSTAQGLTDQNLHVLRRFGIDEIGGVPWLVVVEPDGRVLASSYEVTDENHETPQAMVNWLAQWARTPASPDA
jgi:thiol-disulfide isomerase/thioredoxin